MSELSCITLKRGNGLCILHFFIPHLLLKATKLLMGICALILLDTYIGKYVSSYALQRGLNYCDMEIAFNFSSNEKHEFKVQYLIFRS